MNRSTFRFFVAVAVGALVAGRTLAQPIVSAGQIDTFEDLTTQSWTNGPGAPNPGNFAGGPAGAADHYMRMATNGAGSGAGSRMTVFNRAQWAGDYATNSIAGIDMDLQNFGPNVTLKVRLGFMELIGNGQPGYLSATPVSVPIDGLWHHATFLFSDMTARNGPSMTLAQLLASAPVEARILHSVAGADMNGDTTPGNAVNLGVDNIRAFAAVPEPGSMLLLAAAGGGVVARRFRAIKLNS
jgi:hypothetical protein